MCCNDWPRLKAPVMNLFPLYPFSCSPTLSIGLSFTDHNDLPQAQDDSCNHSLPPKFVQPSDCTTEYNDNGETLPFWGASYMYMGRYLIGTYDKFNNKAESSDHRKSICLDDSLWISSTEKSMTWLPICTKNLRALAQIWQAL